MQAETKELVNSLRLLIKGGQDIINSYTAEAHLRDDIKTIGVIEGGTTVNQGILAHLDRYERNHQ